MYEHPIDKLMGAGRALEDIAEELEKKEQYGLAFVLAQLGSAVFGVGLKLDKEGWEPTLTADN